MSTKVETKLRVLFARFTLDGHDRGLVTIIGACRDAGMEIVYIHFTDPREIVKAATEEDVDAIGVTSSMGQHMRVARELMAEIKKTGAEMPVIFGGVLPTLDIPKLLALGVKRVFGPGSAPGDAIAYIKQISKNN